MGTVYLHIGTPKTGTTAIQEFLYANRGLLKERGFCYPDFGYRYPNIGAWRNGYFLSRVGRDVFIEEKEDSFRQLARLAEEQDKIILSDESIWKKQKKEGFWQTIGGRIREMGCDLHIIVYLRRQDSLMESTWNQRIKASDDFGLSFEEFIRAEHHYMPLQYDRMLRLIQQNAGAKVITARAFERGQLLGGSAIDDFCGIIGFPVDDRCHMPKADANVSLDRGMLEIKRQINKNTAYDGAKNFYQDVILRSHSGEAGCGGEKKSLLSPETREAFLERFAEGNAFVAREFMGREDGRLFYHDMSDSGQWDPVWEEMYPALLRVMSTADTMLYRRIDALEKRLDELSGNAAGQSGSKSRTEKPKSAKHVGGKLRKKLSGLTR